MEWKLGAHPGAPHTQHSDADTVCAYIRELGCDKWVSILDGKFIRNKKTRKENGCDDDGEGDSHDIPLYGDDGDGDDGLAFVHPPFPRPLLFVSMTFPHPFPLSFALAPFLRVTNNLLLLPA